jgi:hypothetical protein
MAREADVIPSEARESSFATSASRRSISVCGSHRPRTITPARRVVFLILASGSASSRMRSARFPFSIVPVSFWVRKWIAMLRVPVSSAWYGVSPALTSDSSSRWVENPGTL